MGEKPNSDTAFLHDVARRIFHQCTPAMGFDQGDSDRLHFIANCLTTAQAALAAKEAELAAEREKVEKLRAREAELDAGVLRLCEVICAVAEAREEKDFEQLLAAIADAEIEAVLSAERRARAIEARQQGEG